MPAGPPPRLPEPDDPAHRARIDRLYTEHAPALLRYLRRLAGADADAADLLHATFLRLWERPMPDAVSSERAWVFRVATNVAHNERRDVRRLRDRERAAAADAPLVGDGRAQQALEARERVSQALAAVDDVRGRRALLLVAEGFTYREIASILDLTPGHVGVLIQRARDQFRRRIEPGA